MSLFDKHRPFLNKLNDVSNACKHSFINTDYNLFGASEPLLFALGLPRNDSSKDSAFHVVPLREMVESFSEFYGWAMKTLNDWVKDSAFKDMALKTGPKGDKS